MENMKKSFNILGKRIRQLRKENKWTQAELAEKIDKTTEMVCHLENGTASTKLKTLETLANVFNVDISDLFQEDSQRYLQSRRLGFVLLADSCRCFCSRECGVIQDYAG